MISRYSDPIIFELPPDLQADFDPTNTARPEVSLQVLEILQAGVVLQYRGAAVQPVRIFDLRAVCKFTRDVWEVDAAQPAHDCQECRAGNERAKAFLRANPGKWIGLATVMYSVEWPGEEAGHEREHDAQLDHL